VGSELFHSDGQMERNDESNCRFRNFPIASNN
jgi:hypothetical protein